MPKHGSNRSWSGHFGGFAMIKQTSFSPKEVGWLKHLATKDCPPELQIRAIWALYLSASTGSSISLALKVIIHGF